MMVLSLINNAIDRESHYSHLKTEPVFCFFFNFSIWPEHFRCLWFSNNRGHYWPATAFKGFVPKWLKWNTSFRKKLQQREHKFKNLNMNCTRKTFGPIFQINIIKQSIPFFKENRFVSVLKFKCHRIIHKYFTASSTSEAY